VFLQAYMKQSDASEDDLMERLSAIYRGRADGKELQIDVDSATIVQAATQEVRLPQLQDYFCLFSPPAHLTSHASHVSEWILLGLSGAIF
jgi:hypothetical protein